MQWKKGSYSLPKDAAPRWQAIILGWFCLGVLIAAMIIQSIEEWI